MDVGGGLNTSGFGAKSLAEDLPTVIDILADVLQHPTFPAAEVEKERGEILTDLEERVNDTRRMAGLTFRKLLYPAGHPYSRSMEGYPRPFRRSRATTWMNFYRSRYGANGMIVSIVGAVKAEAAFEAWERAFGAWHGADGASQRAPLPPAPQVTEVRREFAAVPGKTQSDILLGFVGPARAEPDYWDAALCNTILGVFGLMGRLGTERARQTGPGVLFVQPRRRRIGAGAVGDRRRREPRQRRARRRSDARRDSPHPRQDGGQQRTGR